VTLARVRVVRYVIGGCPDASIYALEEGDSGQPVRRWLPHEHPCPSLAAARFLELSDAKAFALGVDWIRAQEGLLVETVEEIQALRCQLDFARPGRKPRGADGFELRPRLQAPPVAGEPLRR